jgi:hypothetical protein
VPIDLEGGHQAQILEKGVSWGYIISSEEFDPDLNSGWKLYTSPINLEKGAFLYVIATRLGYKDSEIVKISL